MRPSEILKRQFPQSWLALLLVTIAVVLGCSSTALAMSNVNSRVIVEDVGSNYDPADARARAGVFTIDVLFTHIGNEPLTNVAFEVAELSGGNQLLNADGGPGGVGATLRADVGSVLEPGESFAAVFEIGLRRPRVFSFLVNVLAEPRQESLASFDVKVPTLINDGESFTVEVSAVGTLGTRPFPWDGIVTLSAAGATLNGTTSVELNDGVGSATVGLVAATPPVEIVAAANGKTGSGSILTIALSALPGDATSPAAEAIPSMFFTPSAGTYLPGAVASAGEEHAVDIVILSFVLGTTVAEANAIITAEQASIVGGARGIAGAHPGFVVLHLPTISHGEIDDAVTRLSSNPSVKRVVRDVVHEEQAVSRPNAGDPTDWTWALPPDGDNWAFEFIRVPQLWNFNRAIEKTNGFSSVGVIDTGFAVSHADEDLLLADRSGFPQSGDHGTQVAGIIAAEYNNEAGVDGVNPYALLYAWNVKDPQPAPNGTITFAAKLTALYLMATATPDLRVINISIGIVYTSNPANNPFVASLLAGRALLLNDVLNQLETVGAEPFIVVAAGNDSAAGFGLVDALYASEHAYLALEIGRPNILVVEAFSHDPAGGANQATRSNFSNIDGSLSAPGDDITSTGHTTPYLPDSGTSFASPHVAGLASYLFTADPSLTNAQMKEVLLARTFPVDGGASPRVDAYASLLAIDEINGNNAILSRLLDIDDGTADGNQRVDEGGEVFLDEDVDDDGGIGDGSIDMSDFRTFRDWYLAIQTPLDHFLDGPDDHPKRDINDDGEMGMNVDENVWPRGDFNGDGSLDDEPADFFVGSLETVQTDLQILQSLFDDPFYAVGDLPNLLLSGDLHVSAEHVFIPSVVRAESQLWFDAALVDSRPHDDAETRHIYTVPASESPYTVRVIGYDAGDVPVIQVDVTDVLVGLGIDRFFAPEPVPIIDLQVTAPPFANQNEAFPIEVRAGLKFPGTETNYDTDIDISLSAVGGTVVPMSGTTDASGFFNSEGTITGVQAMNLLVTASAPGLDDVVDGRAIQPLPPVLVINDSPWQVHSETLLQIFTPPPQSVSTGPNESGSIQGPVNLFVELPHSDALNVGGNTTSANGTATLSVRFETDPGTGEVTEIDIDGNLQGSAAAAGASANASWSGGTPFTLNFEVREQRTLFWDVTIVGPENSPCCSGFSRFQLRKNVSPFFIVPTQSSPLAGPSINITGSEVLLPGIVYSAMFWVSAAVGADADFSPSNALSASFTGMLRLEP